MLNVRLCFEAPEQIETAALVTWVYEKEAPLEDVLAKLDAATDGQLGQLVAAGELTGKAGETLLLHQPRGLKAQRLLLLGAGKLEKFAPAIDLRRLAGTAARYLKARAVTQLTFLVRSAQTGHMARMSGGLPDQRQPETAHTGRMAQAITEGVLLGNFEPDKYKTEKKDDKLISELQLAGFEAAQQAAVEEAIQRGRVIGEAQNLARELVNEPANRLTPRLFAARAEEIAHQFGLEADILDEKRLAEEQMGAFLAVARGSEEPPRLVVLTYNPPRSPNLASGASLGSPVIGLVGKGITFDSGGISIKPGEGMEKMKYDMAGGATVLGAMRALAELKPGVKVIACIPLTENLPSGRAQKPGDVQIAMSGKAIEVVSTDAEGRLVLADALSYAKKLGCTHLLDVATLTGAIFVALGSVNIGAFSNNDKFLTQVLASAQAVGEKLWAMPLDDDYCENIKSAIADIKNVGSGHGAGAINAAMFLKEFVEETPWVHLDIAGTAWLEEAKPHLAKGATGVGVRTLVHYILSLGEG